ncbi:tyrosine-type recombinase/integrase [Paenibacillus sp. FSL H8-0259]|uniref:tyrosine-type recombinase/integrase n=1 Tax=Paenibacillus sp. FSL H8-0259 TaxID=1920423 RepID=UPI00096BE1A0|nr:tyrosine-type recombinase/integrase [Paenibacillus sp. FSL H8-0259]OMF21861.1 integrase [Paenibacillus sp. FSL H8-0259]
MDKRIGRHYKTRRSNRDDKKLDALFEKFYLAKKASGRSKTTLQSYEDSFRFFCEYMDSRGLAKVLSSVTPEFVREYMSWMLNDKVKWDGHEHKGAHEKTIGLSPVTVNTIVKGIKNMFKFLNEEGYIPTNPLANIKKVSEPEKEIQILSIEQMKKLLSVIDRSTYAGFRDYVLITVLIDSSARIGEVVILDEPDVDFKRGLLFFSENTVKTRRARRVPITKRTVRLLRELISENADFETNHIFLANYGLRLSINQFRQRLKKHARNAGLELNVHPYLFRHTSATLFLENGGDVHHLARTMGHVDIRMTSRYVHLSEKSIKAQHDKYSPIHDVVGKLGKDRKIKRTT